MKRREFIAALGGAAAWPLLARAQQQTMPVVGFITPKGSNNDDADLVAFRRGLNEAGYIEGRNVRVDVEALNGKFDRAPAVVADLVGRQVTAIVATTPGALAAKAATSIDSNRVRNGR
jgi:putative ABC transport system substrate-binding protein